MIFARIRENLIHTVHIDPPYYAGHQRGREAEAGGGRGQRPLHQAQNKTGSLHRGQGQSGLVWCDTGEKTF